MGKGGGVYEVVSDPFDLVRRWKPTKCLSASSILKRERRKFMCKYMRLCNINGGGHAYLSITCISMVSSL